VKRYSASEVAVVPSLYEGFGFPAAEAMSCGIPVISTTAGALLSVLFGLGTWVALEVLAPKGLVPPQLAGLLVAIAWMVVGSLATWRPPEAA